MENKTIQAGYRLHAVIMVFIGATILIITAASTLFYIQNFKKNYLEAIEWRSVTLAQGIRVHLASRYATFGALADTDLILESAYLKCKRLFDANRDMHVSFVCVLSGTGQIITHNDKAYWRRGFDHPDLLAALASRQIRTILLGETYHTLIPVAAGEDTLLGAIDVGFPKKVVDQKVLTAIEKAMGLCLALFVFAFFPAWLFIRQVVTRPVSRLIEATSTIARGDLTGKIHVSGAEEFKRLGLSLIRMRDAISRSMADLARKDQEVKALMACSPVALFSLDLSGTVAIWTASAERLSGWQADDILGKPLPTVPEEDRESFGRLFCTACDGGVVLGHEIRQQRKDGSFFSASLSSAPIRDSSGAITGVMGTIEDISQRVERENAHEKVRAQLLQAQKMESVGRLAGGVAHDYNNTLGVILGYAELLQESLPPEDPRGDDLKEIIRATLHSADITRQLLAFARKQTIAPKVIDLNRRVENMLKMLRRLIGENIELEWIPQENLGTVKMDKVQVDQVLANLCINARDAMNDTGKITIETRSATVDEAYCGTHPGFKPGEFVCLSVSDTGAGMDRQTLEKIFEPFFTTKGRGEGTGLGLSTVYGIVKQNEGFINVYSEPGKGTIFHVYFSRHWGEAREDLEGLSIDVYPGKGETVLLVEDDAAILKISKQMLEKLGYRVMDAGNPAEAVSLARENRQDLQLLITDVILPEMNGRELSRRILSVCPGAKVLFMSGYTANVIAHQGVLDDGVNFLQKPFSKKDLATTVRMILDR